MFACLCVAHQFTRHQFTKLTFLTQGQVIHAFLTHGHVIPDSEAQLEATRRDGSSTIEGLIVLSTYSFRMMFSITTILLFR